jgi:ADP-heptose:LPS heptosyltransferase
MHPQLDIWLRGYPLDYVANVLKHAKLVISVESGLAKLAIAQDVKTAILFPNILPLNVFAPVWSKNLKIAIVDVTTMEPPGLLLGLKQIIEQFHLE